MTKKTIVVFSPSRFDSEVWLPTLWSQAKTYYEKNGNKVDEWSWAPCYADMWGSNLDKVKLILGHTEPDVFAVSLYVWNYSIGHEIAKWVKNRWPDCLVITGGPHQYFKYDSQWFQNHPYIDASLPGASYGELCFQEILDNVDTNNKINWNVVSDVCYPVGQKREPFYSKTQLSTQDKKQFDYDWPSFANQRREIFKYINYQTLHFPKAKLLSVFETTRGCPYGCTYCDWGGGTATVVIKKSDFVLDQDLNFLMSLNLSHLYIADANFGIFGERDVNIIKTIIKYKQQYLSNVSIGYGGFAKTENKLEYIRQIVMLDSKNNLGWSDKLKISMQSLDSSVLRNIDRKNISLDKQVKMFLSVGKKNKLPLYVEMILGLPGMTLDIFYRELDELGKDKLSAMWFEWLLLPETPSYNPAYIKQFGIKSITKLSGWAHDEQGSEREIVTQSNSYTQCDYLEMLLTSSLYHAIIQGGLYKDSINWISQNHHIGVGQIIKAIYNNFPRDEGVAEQWNKIVTDPNELCVFDVKGYKVYGGFYFVARAFLDDKFVDDLGAMLQKAYSCPAALISNDMLLANTLLSTGTSVRKLCFKIKKPALSLDTVVNSFMNYANAGKILRGTKGLI